MTAAPIIAALAAPALAQRRPQNDPCGSGDSGSPHSSSASGYDDSARYRTYSSANDSAPSRREARP